MADYLSPATYANNLPQMPLGPGTGFLSGMHEGIANDIVSRAMRDQDLQYAIDQIRQQSDQAKLELQKAQNVPAIAQAGAEADAWQPGGLAQQAYQTGLQAKTAGNETQVTADKVNQIMQRGSVYVQAGSALDALGPNPSPLDPSFQQWNNDTVQKLRAVGVPNVPDVFGPSDISNLQAARQGFINSLPHLQQMAAINQTYTGKAALEGVKQAGDYQRAMDVAGLKGEYGLAVQKYKTDLAMALSQNAKNEEERMQKQLVSIKRQGILTANGGDVQGNIQIVERAAQLQAEDELSKIQPMFRVLNMMGSDPTDPKSVESKLRANQMLEQKTAEILAKFPGYTQAKALQTGGQGNPLLTAPGGPPTGNNQGLPTIKSDADFNALPSGAEFIAPDGSHRKKP